MLEKDCFIQQRIILAFIKYLEITYYLSTLSKQVRPLITLSFNHPKPTEGLDALSVPTQRLLVFGQTEEGYVAGFV